MKKKLARSKAIAEQLTTAIKNFSKIQTLAKSKKIDYEDYIKEKKLYGRKLQQIADDLDLLSNIYI